MNTTSIEWQMTTYGSTHYTYVGRVRLEVSWADGGGYTAHVGDLAHSKPGIFKDREIAQQWALNKLREIASEILTKLGGTEAK